MTPLHESVWRLLQDALDVYWDDPVATQRIHDLLGRFEEPLRIVVAGPGKSGKSTLINAIVGDEVAPVDITEGFVWYGDGPQPRVTAYSSDGAARELAVTRSAGGMRVDLGALRPDQVSDVVVEWPTRALKHMTLVDTVAVQGDVLIDADAVLYLTPDRRDTDLQTLQSIQEGTVATTAPVNVILVLSRADEVGGGRIDALLAARQLGRRHQRDPQVAAVCMSVVAFSGLVALASRILSEVEFATLAAMAQTPDLERFLLSADRFAGPEFPMYLSTSERVALLDRFGIHGLRLATTLIRAGNDTRAKLAAELARRSGLTELRESMNQYFVDRREVLKARSALVALELMLRAEPRRGTEELLAQMEQIVAAAHDFRELRLLAALRSSGVGFEAELLTEAHRLVGGNGTDMAARLGIDHNASDDELWARIREALHRWQNQAEDQRLNLQQRRASRVVVRSCEALLAYLSRA